MKYNVLLRRDGREDIKLGSLADIKSALGYSIEGEFIKVGENKIKFRQGVLNIDSVTFEQEKNEYKESGVLAAVSDDYSGDELDVSGEKYEAEEEG